MVKKEFEWINNIPEGAFISTNPTYEVGKYFELYEKDFFTGDTPVETTLKYYFYDPTKHGYPAKENYPVLIFLHGKSNSLVGDTCINYCGAEAFASPEYQNAFRGAYVLVPIANEKQDENGRVSDSWSGDFDYSDLLYGLIEEFINKHTKGVGKKFLFGNSAGATMTFIMGNKFTGYFDALIPVGSSAVPTDAELDKYDEAGTYLFLAFSKHDESGLYATNILPRIPRLEAMKHCFIFTPDWTYNGDKGIASINFGKEMGQHCLMNEIQANIMFDDNSPMDERLPRGMVGWIDEVNRKGPALAKEYAPHGGSLKTGYVKVDEETTLFYEEYGTGSEVILSAQVGFYHRGMQQKMADLGYHVFCITLRGFHPSSLTEKDYGENWYDVFASDVLSFADKMGIDKFTYMGASHGAGVGWHLMLKNSGRVKAFVAVVAGPHSLKEGTMSYRQMIEQGIIKCVPPFDPPIDGDSDREKRRAYREKWISNGPEGFEEERKLDYGRPLMRLKTEENLCNELKKIDVPTLLIGGYDDPISKPELLMRTAGCLPHCKLVMYSNCGHNIDTDIYEEVSDEADRFLKNVFNTGKVYLPVKE